MIGRYLAERRGAAAVEFALWLFILVVPLMNVLDLGYYAFQAMQVREAAQAAAESTIACATTLPAATNCPTLSTAITTAAQSTSLGSKVSVSASSEGYYCSNTNGSLKTASVSSGTNPWSLTATSTPPEPTSCSGTVSTNAGSTGDYVAVTTSYTFHPIFGTVTITSLLPTTITQQAWMRLG